MDGTRYEEDFTMTVFLYEYDDEDDRKLYV